MVFKKKQPKTEGVVVGGKKKLRMPDVKKLKNIDWHTKKARLLLILAGLIVVLIPVGFYVYGDYIGNRNLGRIITSSTCRNNSEIISMTVKAYNNNDLNRLIEVSQAITKLDNYRNDPNCLHILTIAYLSTGEISKANESFDRLQLINRNDLLMQEINNDAFAVTEIKMRLDYYNEKINQIKNIKPTNEFKIPEQD